MPENYSFNIPSPTQRLLGGIQQGLGIGNVLEQREQRDIQFEQQQEDRKTAAVRQKWDLLTKEKQTNQLRFGGKVIAALGSSPKFGVDMLKERAEAERNSGNEQEAAEYDRWAEIAEINPEGVKEAMTTLLATLPGGAKIVDSIGKARPREGKPVGIDPVQSSKILDDGTVQIVRKSGAVEVVSPEESTKELVKQAQRFGAELQGLRKGEREAAGAAIKQSIEAFKKLAPIKKNIKNLNEGIRLIDEGAQTGVIAKRFPSIKTASIALENLQGRLGLDIIADVTFGALSESELAFAKDTALPIGLEGEPLKDWLARKRDAQKALAESLEEAALFLGEPGNSVPDYIRMKRAQQTQPTATPQAQPAQAGGELTAAEQVELDELRQRFQ